jgi:hypothetical protein
MHDSARLEEAGVVTVTLVTTAFLKAAQEQWEALGFKEEQIVTVGHPLGSFTKEKTMEEADKTLLEVIKTIRGGS